MENGRFLFNIFDISGTLKSIILLSFLSLITLVSLVPRYTVESVPFKQDYRLKVGESLPAFCRYVSDNEQVYSCEMTDIATLVDYNAYTGKIVQIDYWLRKDKIPLDKFILVYGQPYKVCIDEGGLDFIYTGMKVEVDRENFHMGSIIGYIQEGNIDCEGQKWKGFRQY